MSGIVSGDDKVVIRIGVEVDEEATSNTLGLPTRSGRGAMPQQMQQVVGAAGQARGLMTGGVGGLGMTAVSFMGPIGAGALGGLAMVKLAEAVYEELTRAGGFMDLRFKRDLEESIFQSIDRQRQRDRAVGNEQVVIQSSAAFMQKSGYLHSNTYRQITEGTGDKYRQSKLGVEDHSYGGNRY